MCSLALAYTIDRRGLESFGELFERARAGVRDAPVRKLPEPRLTNAGSIGEGTAAPSRKSSGLKVRDGSVKHHVSLAKYCETVKQPFESPTDDNSAVEEIKGVLAQNLQRLLDQYYGGSQNALARASKVAQTTIGNYLRPDSYKGAPQLDKIAKLARALHLKEAYLLLMPGLVVGKRGPATQGEIEEEVQRRFLARWDAIAREVEGLRVAHESEPPPRPVAHHPATPRHPKKEKP